MKTAVAILLVMVSLATAQPARFRPSARQQEAPYPPSGWRPQGAAFALPKSQPQQAYGPPSPAASYGPPAEEPTTAEYEIADVTAPPQVAKINAKSAQSKKSEAVEEQKGAYYVLLPQSVVVPETRSQSYVYAVADVEKSAPLVTVPQAAIVTAPLPTAKLQALPFATYKTLYSPLSAQYVQVDW